MNLCLCLTLNCLRRVPAARSHPGPPRPLQYASGSHCSIPWRTGSLSLSASSQLLVHTLSTICPEDHPHCVRVCATLKPKRYNEKKKKKNGGWLGPKEDIVCWREAGRGLPLSSSSPFSPAWSVHFHRISRTKGVSAFEEELKIKVAQSYLQV